MNGWSQLLSTVLLASGPVLHPSVDLHAVEPCPDARLLPPAARRPHVEEVVRLGLPDQYEGGNPVTHTTTVLKEISLFPQPLQKPYLSNSRRATKPSNHRDIPVAFS